MRRLLFPAFFLFCQPTLAGENSVYTDFDLKACVQVTPETSGEEGESSGVYECAGFGKYVVTCAEGDLRSFVSFGMESGDQCALQQTFSGFNSVGKKIEWRLRDGEPIATIFRWTVSYDPEDSSKTKTWLVVTKLERQNSCHMGYVEGSYPNANQKARWLADQAAAFSCDVGVPTFFANPGTATEGIVSSAVCAR
jgi:hypothetical protein